MRTETGVWSYLAVNKQALQSGDGRRWRIFIGGCGDAIPIFGCSVAGPCIPDVNWKTETTPDGAPDHRDLIGWVSLFGTVSITDDEHAIIQLEKPHGHP